MYSNVNGYSDLYALLHATQVIDAPARYIPNFTSFKQEEGKATNNRDSGLINSLTDAKILLSLTSLTSGSRVYAKVELFIREANSRNR